ncbi:MAG: hypothetical protein E7334_05625 [Clostridiales bacterium]|nr:hypothetical protein [Clostridiales bacterium]
MEGIRDSSVNMKIISDPKEHCFYGYYDLQPYDSTGKKHLAHRVGFIDRLPTIDDVCELGYIDVDTGVFYKLSETTAWNFQQGSLLQWYKDDDHIVYNVRVGDGFGTQIKNIKTGETRTLPLAAANISMDGKRAVCVNMSRIYDFRPGYGYSDKPDPYYNVNAPADDGVFLMDMETGNYKQIISYDKLIKQFPEEPFTSRKLVINHITFNPSGTRFLFLLRNFMDEEFKMWKTQLLTSDLEGNTTLITDYCLNSHYHWKNDDQILIVTSHPKKDGMDLVLLDDFTAKRVEFYDRPELHKDIHCLYSPNRRYISGDGYPDEDSCRKLWLLDTKTNELRLLLRAYSYAPSIVDIRCDLHARWDRSGSKISFDSNHIGSRCICEIDLSNEIEY